MDFINNLIPLISNEVKGGKVGLDAMDGIYSV